MTRHISAVLSYRACVTLAHGLALQYRAVAVPDVPSRLFAASNRPQIEALAAIVDSENGGSTASPAVGSKGPLDLLAERCGIEDTFRDARGVVQKTAPDTRQALLAAMGFDVTTDEQAQAVLDDLQAIEWTRPAPPVLVVVAAGSVSVPITYPRDTDAISWTLRLESGAQCAGHASFRSLALISRGTVAGTWRERRALSFDQGIPTGYHTLLLEPGSQETLLVVSPGNCWLPEDFQEGKRLWGVSAQLYLLASSRNWGIGDFTDLTQLVHILAGCGADAVGLNPLHAMFPDNPEHASPYSPASRLLLNILNIDVEAAAEEAGCAAALQAIRRDDFQHALRRSREGALVDYDEVTRLKMPLLRVIFDSLRNGSAGAPWLAFEQYRQAAGEPFGRHCVFLALRQHFAAQSPSVPDWKNWPLDYRLPDSTAVQEFAHANPATVSFQAWLQFQADRQLQQASCAAETMAIGLYRDLAVGADPSGAETWSNPRAVVSGAQVGAPPDIYNPAGQDWGLPPFNPMTLKQEGYRSFIDLVRANMRHAGGLRIDHVMGLQQLYWVPTGSTAAQGAYVRYPIEDLIGILALESHRNKCLIVGEDLGTVPEGFRERMQRANILSYRVLFFEKDNNAFHAPDRYPPLSLAVAGSHDLPPLIAWLRGDDLALKQKLGLFPNAQLFKDALSDRASDKEALFAVFDQLDMPAGVNREERAFADTAHAFLARSNSLLTMLQLDDITEETTPVNVPATIAEHPNWRRRLSMSLEEIALDPHFLALARMLNQTRKLSQRAA